MLYSQFKRKFAISMYKNMEIPLGEMSFLKDFVNDTKGDLYPLTEKSADCSEAVEANRYRVEKGWAERVFCAFFPFATYELTAEELKGEAGLVFRLPDIEARLILKNSSEGLFLSYCCGEHTEKIALPDAFGEETPLAVSCRPGFFDIYYRQNGGAKYIASVDEPLFLLSNCYDVFKDAYVSLFVKGRAVISRLSSVLDNGVSIADFRALKYEDGTVIHEGGKVYFTASVRTHAGNYQTIFSWVPGTAQLEMTGALFFDKGDGFWRGYIASTLLYDRERKQWYVYTSSFDHEHIIARGAFDGDPRFGVNVVDVKLMEPADEKNKLTDFAGFCRDEDPDLIYDVDGERWLLAICRVDPEVRDYRYVFFESKDPLGEFKAIGCGVKEGSSETGGSFVRLGGELYFVCGNSYANQSEYRIYSKDGMKLARFRYPDGGFRGWGCIVPVRMGSRTRCFWLTFDRHNGSSYNWSYGNFYCFEAEEI